MVFVQVTTYMSRLSHTFPSILGLLVHCDGNVPSPCSISSKQRTLRTSVFQSNVVFQLQTVNLFGRVYVYISRMVDQT
jgi:hypothetical protein